MGFNFPSPDRGVRGEWPFGEANTFVTDLLLGDAMGLVSLPLRLFKSLLSMPLGPGEDFGRIGDDWMSGSRILF